MLLEVVDFVEWPEIGRLPWNAYRAMMSIRRIALEKQSGLRPVRVVETWRRLMTKCILRVTGKEANVTC